MLIAPLFVRLKAWENANVQRRIALKGYIAIHMMKYCSHIKRKRLASEVTGEIVFNVSFGQKASCRT